MRHVEVSDQVFWTLEAIFSVHAEDRPTQSEFTSHELFLRATTSPSTGTTGPAA